MAVTYGVTDRCTGGACGEDGHEGSAACSYAFDNIKTTASYWGSPAAACPHYLSYTFAAGVYWKISKVMIRPYGGGFGPNAFTINGGAGDTLLYSGNCTNSESDQTFTFTNKSAYNTIKIIFTSSYYGSGRVYVEEVEMYEGIYPPVGGFSGFSPWIFMKDMWEKHKKLWTPKGLILPKDLGFEY